MTADLRRLVELESPSDSKQLCDKLACALADEFESIGGKVRLHRQKQAGDHLQVEFEGRRDGKPILLVGHYDTVHAAGTLQAMPWRENRGRLCGPGIFDMKAGIVQMKYALSALRDALGELPCPVTVLLVSDEEVGSPTSRKITESLAKRSSAALVCEPAAGPKGALKTARKGVGDFLVRVEGVASHAGLDFERGQSAILELAHQVAVASGFTDLKRGITVNAGVIRGGTRSNVVAASAEAEIDVRIQKASDAKRVERLFQKLRVKNRACRLTVSGSINRPPMERTRSTIALFQKAQAVARELGFPVEEIAVGGGSDGNFISALGVPVLDGLGPVGDGAHSAHEFVVAGEMPRRAALLAGLIQVL